MTDHPESNILSIRLHSIIWLYDCFDTEDINKHAVNESIEQVLSKDLNIEASAHHSEFVIQWV
jgi:hypothetical protein